MTALLTPQTATPRCTATVALLSVVFRPWLFEVTVTGEPPHEVIRKYKIAADTEDSAAISGLRLFVKEFTTRVIAQDMVTLDGKAKLQ